MAEDGYWGERTATIDWCEENYAITHYIAEFWNTISNLIMIIFPLYSIYWTLRHNKLQNQKKKSGEVFDMKFILPKSTIVAQLGLLLVGIGSWMFHMTLLYPMQLLDELPMIYGSGVLIYANYELIALTFKHDNLTRSDKQSKKSFLALIVNSKYIVRSIIVVYSLLVTFVYLSVWKNPIFHETAYGFMVFVLGAQSIFLIKRFQSTQRIYLTSLIYYLIAFIFWNLDNNFCFHLKSLRENLDNVFGTNDSNHLKSIICNIFTAFVKSFLEFHALWHIFVGYAAYMAILFLIDTQYQFHLEETKQKSGKVSIKPVGTKFAKLYFYLTNQLLRNDSRKIH